jgi:hypothetical protein
MFNALSH